MKPITLTALANALNGMGVFELQLDDLRLFIPAKVRARLRSVLPPPFVMMVCCWKQGCLSVVPKAAWTEHLSLIRPQLGAGNANLISEQQILRTATETIVTNRINIPRHLARLAGIEERAACVLETDRGWLEISAATAQCKPVP